MSLLRYALVCAASLGLLHALPARGQDGALDPTFGAGGLVTHNLGRSIDDGGNAVAIQGDGRIVAVGYTWNGLDPDFAVARFTPDGQPDPTFGSGGVVSTAFGVDIQDEAHAVAVQSDGRIVVAGAVYGDFGLARYNADGSLDPTFGDGGRVTTSFGTSPQSFDSARDVAIQSDGRIVVVGEAHNGSFPVFALARYNADGSLDETFGTGGLVRTPFDPESSSATSIGLLADGRIIAVGYASTGSSQHFALARYDADGNLDASFGTGGRVTTAFGDDPFTYDQAQAVAVLPGGKVVAVGSTNPGGSNDSDFAMARYDEDGSLDETFGMGGRVTTAFGPEYDVAWDVTAQADGHIIVGGTSSVEPFGGDYAIDIALARYDEGGSLDDTFGTGGRVTASYGENAYSVAAAVAVQADGRVVVAGSVRQSVGEFDDRLDITLVRFTPVGALDVAFGADGWAMVDGFVWGTDGARAATVQADGSIVAVGLAHNGLNDDFAAARLTPDGALDPAFGGDGWVTTDFGSYDVAAGLAVQADGRIVAAGWTYGPFGSEFALARYTANGELDATFGGDGRVTTAFSAGSPAEARALAVQPDGRIVVAGLAHNGFHPEFGVARYEADGELDETFGTGGRVTTTIGEYAEAHAVAIQPDGRIVVAGYAFTGSGDEFAVVRYTPDGQLDPTFGSDGQVTVAVGSDAYARAVALQPSGRIVVAGSTEESFDYDFALVRLTSSGSLDGSFGTGGRVTTSFGRNAFAFAVAVDGDGRIIAAGRAEEGFGGAFAVARYSAEGEADASFGVDGRMTEPFGGARGGAYAVAVQPDGRLVVAGETQNPHGLDFALIRLLSDPLGTAGEQVVEPSSFYLTVAPNPVHRSAVVRYALPTPARVRLTLYDLLGREVAVLVGREVGAGPHEVPLDGSALPSGTYVLRLQAGRHALAWPFTVIR